MTREEDNGSVPRVITAAAVGGTAMAGTAVGIAHPGLAVPMAGMVAMCSDLVKPMLDRVVPIRHRQRAKAIAVGARSEGIEPRALAERAVQTEFRQLLTADTLDAAAHSAHEQKVVALGRAWARGVVTDDDAELAREHQFVRTISRLEFPHVRVLDLIAQTPVAGRQPTPLATGWTHEAVSRDLPEYGAMTGQLLAVLASEWLVFDTTIDNALSAGTQYRITPAGSDVLRRLVEATENLPDDEIDGEPERVEVDDPGSHRSPGEPPTSRSDGS